MSRDRNSARRAEIRAKKRDNAKREILGTKPHMVTIPDPIIYAVAGTRIAADGKPYTITYQPEDT